MHKVRLTQNNYQLVAENGGQSPEVLMSNYNEALDSEKRNLALLIETNFYSQKSTDSINEFEEVSPPEAHTILEALHENPELSQQIMQILMSGAAIADRGTSKLV